MTQIGAVCKGFNNDIVLLQYNILVPSCEPYHGRHFYNALLTRYDPQGMLIQLSMTTCSMSTTSEVETLRRDDSLRLVLEIRERLSHLQVLMYDDSD